MPYTTTKYALRAPLGTEAADGPTGMKNLADDVDAKMAGYAEGLKAAIPAAGKNGRVYFATDTAEWFFDTGSVWMTIIGSRGKSNIPGEESRTNVAYGKLPTSDEVTNIVLPADGLILVALDALVKNSVGSAGRVALFLNAVQLAYGTGGGATSPVEVSTGANTDYNHVATNTSAFQNPLVCAAAAGDAVTVATGMANGAVLPIWAAAGIYTLSAQFKASSGSVFAKERKLWVWTESFD